MKKILFATTALVATAGIAAAEVKVTGFAEVGIAKNENGSGDFMSGDLTKTQVFTDLNVTFTMTGTADNGLTFGATFDLEDIDFDGDRTDSSRLPDSNIFLSFGGATLTVGDTDSAFDARLTETAIGGAINDDHTVHPGYSGNSFFDEPYGGQEVRFDYKYDAFTFSVSMSPDRFGIFDTSYAVGVSYKGSMAGFDLGLGLGYIKVDDLSSAYDSALGMSVDATFDNGLKAILNYSLLQDDTGIFDDGSHVGIGLGYTMNALTIGANYGKFSRDFGDRDGYGLTVNYDFGGGLVAQFGYGGGDFEGPATYEDTYSFGVAMSF